MLFGYNLSSGKVEANIDNENKDLKTNTRFTVSEGRYQLESTLFNVRQTGYTKSTTTIAVNTWYLKAGIITLPV